MLVKSTDVSFLQFAYIPLPEAALSVSMESFLNAVFEKTKSPKDGTFSGRVSDLR